MQNEVESQPSEGTGTDDPLPPRGNEVGTLCYSTALQTVDANGLTGEVFEVDQNRGKVTVINFWGTWCGPCVAELPHFNEVAKEYADDVTVVAVHTVYGNDKEAAYIAENYADSPIIFATDLEGEAYYGMLTLGGNPTYPMTIIVDADGIVTANIANPMTHEELIAAVEDAMGK